MSCVLSNPEDHGSLPQQEEMLKTEGMALATNGHYKEVLRDQILMLQVLLSSPTETCTLDDVTDDLEASFPHGGQWRGQVPLRLARIGVIYHDGHVMSKRPSRRRGYLTRWRMVHRETAEFFLKCLIRELRTKLMLEETEKRLRLLEEAIKNLPAAATTVGQQLNGTASNSKQEEVQ